MAARRLKPAGLETLIRRAVPLTIAALLSGPLPSHSQTSPPLEPAAAAAQAPAYSLAASVRMSRGYISQAAWLDETHMLSLVVTPDAVEVWRTNIETLERERFISSSLITGHVCPLELASRLSWTMSPQRNFIFFKWFEDNGARRWALLDISTAPKFRLKTFAAPAGMQISRVLFSADDRYAAFIDDSFIEGSPVSVLVMDLSAGTETWRISSEQLGFVVDEWWRSDLAPDTLQFGAALYDGEFFPSSGLATAALATQTLEYSAGSTELLAATGADWGWAACSQVDGGTPDKYLLEIHQTAGGTTRVDLDLRPLDVVALDAPGCVLLLNSADLVTSKLWVVNAADPLAPQQVDADCREIAVAPDGKLLVLAGGTNEVRIYEP